MPASTLDPVNAALRTALSKSISDNSLDSQLAGSTKKALLSNIEFEPAGSYQSSVLDKLKSKYIVLKSSETPETSSKPKLNHKSGDMNSDETLILAKHELYPLDSVQLGWNNADWSVGAGMVNMGNTCYLNSTLQALFHVPALVNWLVSDKQHMSECEDSGAICIICAMRKTLQDSQQRNVNSIRPFLIYTKLRVVCRNLIPGRQEDAHEFLRYLVEAMEKAYLNRFKNHLEFDSRTKETTPLNQILGGYLRSTVRCLECGHISTTFQHFQDLLLDIRKAQTVDEALDSYFSREKLDDDSYHCESCQRKVNATKQFSLERAPMVLCIQLKRFSVSNNKITKHIQFRQRLDLTRYMRCRPATALVYKLVALVTHMGPTVSCGHYTAVAQAPSGSFYQFDDSMVRPISHQAVFGTNAYIMLYELEPLTQLNHKTKIITSPTSTVTQPGPQESNYISNFVNGNSKVYGPELPPVKVEKITNGQNVDTTHSVNGISELSEASSSESENEQTDIQHDSQKENKQIISNTVSLYTSTKNCDSLDNELKAPKSILISKSNDCSQNSTSNGSSNRRSPLNDGDTTANGITQRSSHDTITKTAQPVTKLVPYDMDDSSSCSEESPDHLGYNNSRVPTKATCGDWKVSSSTSETQEPSSSEGKSWDKRKSNTSVTSELLRLSHGGYAAPISSWNGTRSQLDKEISNERRDERKRALSDNADQGRIKHPKISGNGPHKYNSNYNPVQEYHNTKNWNNQNNSSHYRHFYISNRHRNNRRNFHHKNYHKSYRFRQ